MARSTKKNSDDTGKPEDETMLDDDVTVSAETPASKTDFIEEEMNDINIRYEIPFRKGSANEDDFKLYVKLLIVITTAFDKSSVRIYDNNNNRIRNFKEPKWQNQEYFKDHFHVHVETNQRKSVIVHRIMTKKTISEIKNEPTVIQQLKASTTYLRAHFWKEDEVSLKDIGFLLNYVPTKHSKEFVANDIFERCTETEDVYWTHAPEFKLIHSQPKITLTGRKNPLKTHAFSVQVRAKEASKMNKFLQKIYEEDHNYIPYTMKKSFPKAVAAGILAQNKLIKNTWVIVLIGIPRNVMRELVNNILESSGVTGISETNRTDKTGRWNILVTESTFKSLRKLFTKHIQEWIRELPSEVQATIPNTFPPPKVYQKNSYDDDDDEDSSYGQASYMSSCAQSYASFADNENDEQFFNPPGKYNSYAAALSAKIPPPTGTEVLVHKKGRNPLEETPTTTETTEYKATITNLQHEVTIAQLQAEIQTLKAHLRGASTPSDLTEISTSNSTIKDTHATEDRMASIENNMAMMTKQFSTWMKELRTNEHGYGSKPSETSPTPQESNQEMSVPGSQKNERPVDNTPTSHASKRTDTRTTPVRRDHMEGVELFSATEESRPGPSQLSTQPPGPSTPPCDNNNKRPLSPSTPDSPNMASMLEALAQALPTYPEGYDSDEPMYVYRDNGNGTLFCVGLAQPNDFHPDGTIKGPQPTEDQSETIRTLFQIPDPDEPSHSQTPSPVNTLATQDLSDDSSNNSHPEGHLSPTPEEQIPVTGSSTSLPAEGAQTDHV
jgi:hypothetical protein